MLDDGVGEIRQSQMRNMSAENMIIRNREELLSHGLTRGRGFALEIIDHALRAVDPHQATKKLIHHNDRWLTVDNRRYDLQKRGNIYVLGAGKASFPIAQALEEILGDRIARGVVIVKRGQKGCLRRIKKIEAGHPLPDESGFRGAQEIVRIAEEAAEGDLVFAVITGGSSALMPYPADGITLEEIRTVTDHLLASGAVIQEINAVRKHVSRIKGGRLAVLIHPAEIINLTVSDVVGDWTMLDCITGNTVPDTSTFHDALSTLKKYRLWDKAPDSVRNHLQHAPPHLETPKRFEGIQVLTFLLATNLQACSAAKDKAEILGLNAAILSTMIEGESRDVGIVHAGIAREVEAYNRPFRSPCVLISGGETTVTMEGKPGRGGPNQEFILGFATKIGGSRRIVGASVDTDGTDGPTDVAGGMADGLTLERARARNLNIYESLRRHDSHPLLHALGDAVYTGSTGTNVMNLRVIIISE